MKGRNLGLDLLRLFAVLLVMGRHIVPDPGRTWIIDALRRGGWIGVDLFFVLSGFLVSGLLFKEVERTGRVRAGRFLVRRGFRIYPAFYVMLVYIVLTAVVFAVPRPPMEVMGPRILAEALFVQNYFPALSIHTWSLAVEEHFYFGIALLFPLLLRTRKGLDLVPWIFALLAVGCLALRARTAVRVPVFDDAVHVFPTHLRMDALFFGVFLAWLFHRRQLTERLARVPTWALVVVGCLLLSPAFLVEMRRAPWMWVYGLSMLSLGSGALLLAGIRLQSSQRGWMNALGSAGAASYSIYLWHILVNAEARRHILAAGGSWLTYAVVYVVGGVIWGMLLHRGIEWPTLRLRDRLMTGHTNPTVVSAPE